MNANDPEKFNVVWTDGGIVKAADAYGDEIWAAPQGSYSRGISFKSVPRNEQEDGNPWVTLDEERTREFLEALARQIAVMQG